MTLRGSLTDLDIVELLQVPAAGRKTGELLIATLEADARLYFVDGRLVHLAMDDREGEAVLEEIVGWRDGEFEFRPDTLTDRVTFESDLHQALMRVLKQRDERAASPADRLDPVFLRVVSRSLADSEAVRHAAVVTPELEVVPCHPEGSETPEWIHRLVRPVADLFARHPRRGLRRVLLEDEEGAVVAARCDAGPLLIVAAAPATPMGAVSIVVERAIRTINQAHGGDAAGR